MASWATTVSAQTHHYLYAATAPECPSNNGADCSGYPARRGYINIYDMDQNWKLIRVIHLPTTVKAIRGIFSDAGGSNLYLPNYGVKSVNTNKTSARLLCWNLVSNAAVYDKQYSLAAIDRACLSSDGATIYAPAGENVATGSHTSDWYVIRASDGVQTGLITLSNKAIRPHNTVCSASTIYMSAVDVNGGLTSHHSVTMYNIASGQQTVVGPFVAGTGRIRPFAVDQAHGLVYVNLEDWVGFAVGNTAGQVLYDSQKPPGYTEPGTHNLVNSHGIAVTPDGNKLYVADPKMGAGSSRTNGVEVWDVSGVRNGTAPVYKQFIRTSRDSHIGNGRNPGWLTMMNNGLYLHVETGEIVDTQTDTIVAHLADPRQKDGHGAFMRTRYVVEIDN
jgi:hypothetical protein